MASRSPIKIGIIGGSGLDDPDILEGRTERYVETPFGKPSDALILGKIRDVQCVLLARHGRKHTIMPSNVNYRANIWALKEEKCTHILVTTACGSLREDIRPGDIVLIDQFIDRAGGKARHSEAERRKNLRNCTNEEKTSPTTSTVQVEGLTIQKGDQTTEDQR